MTLFNKVFNKHKNSAFESPPAASDQVEPRLSERAFGAKESSSILDAFDADDTAFAPELFEEPAPVKPPTRQNSEPVLVPASVTRDLAEAAAVADATVAAAQSAPSPVQSMSERAAQAHQQIEKSQFGHLTDSVPAPAPSAALAPEPVSETAASPRPGRGSRRVRTRMLGFDTGDNAAKDVFSKADPSGPAPAQTHPVGWMVVVSGPGVGHWFALFNGVSTIGRAKDQTVGLDFGDTSISREKHAAVAFDDESNAFFLGHGGKSNIVRLNGRPVLSTEDLSHGDVIRIGETGLRFVALCGPEFAWGTPENADM